MIRTSLEQIDVINHLVTFRCDSCGTVQENVNVNTQLSYADASKENIVVPCTASVEICPDQPATNYPKNGGPVSQKLHQAKTE